MSRSLKSVFSLGLLRQGRSNFNTDVTDPVNRLNKKKYVPDYLRTPKNWDTDVCQYPNETGIECGVVPRINMPVVNNDELVRLANENGYEVSYENVPFRKLLPLQSEINGNVVANQFAVKATKLINAKLESPEAYENALDQVLSEKGLEVCKGPNGTFHVVDGHHGYATLKMMQQAGLVPKSVNRLVHYYDATFDELIQTSDDFAVQPTQHYEDAKYAGVMAQIVSNEALYESARNEANKTNVFGHKLPSMNELMPFYRPPIDEPFHPSFNYNQSVQELNVSMTPRTSAESKKKKLKKKIRDLKTKRTNQYSITKRR